MLVWALRLLKMVLVLPETAGSLLGMSVVGKKMCSCKNLGDENTNIVTITVPYMVVTRSFRWMNTLNTKCINFVINSMVIEISVLVYIMLHFKYL